MAKCAKCGKVVAKKNPGVQCSKCNKWYHGSCASLTTEQLSALSNTDSVDWKCRGCSLTIGGKSKRISVILPDPDDEESEAEGTVVNESKALTEIRLELRQFRQSVRDIIRDELQTTLNFYSSKIDEYEAKAKDHDLQFKLMDNQIKDMTNTIKNMTLRNEALEQQINKWEQAQASNDVEICGIQERASEDVQKIAETLCQALGQNTEDIVKVYRKKRPTRPGSAQAERAKVDAPITVSLREGKRDRWCEAAKNKAICAQDLGGEGNSKVYLRESLTPFTSYLLWKTKASLKEKLLCKYVWCRNGQIMVRKEEGEKKIYYVRSEKDIDRIGKELRKT